MKDLIETRLLNGFYPKHKLQYHPVADEQLSKAQVDKLKKQGIREELIEPNYKAEDDR